MGDETIDMYNLRYHTQPSLRKTSFDKSSRASCLHCLRLHLRFLPPRRPHPRRLHQGREFPAVSVDHAQAEVDVTAVEQVLYAAEERG